MTDQQLNIASVAIIGAGVSGVAAAVHLHRAGLDVTVYERTSRAGGIWVYDERISNDASYPSVLPSTGDCPDYDRIEKALKRPRTNGALTGTEDVNKPKPPLASELAVAFAPPGPCYISLKNNVSTVEMEMTCHAWKAGTAEFVPHHVLADYIQDSAVANGVDGLIQFNTRVNRIHKTGPSWNVHTSQIVDFEGSGQIVESEQRFDAVVVASGHYHACNIPDIPGLSEWKRRFPDSVRHSKLYRSAEHFKNQNVLLIGAGVSSTDIARDLGEVAASIFQSSRGGPYDLPSHLLPANAARIGALASFDMPSSDRRLPDGSLPATVTLKTGQTLCGVHQVIVCTGYHVSLPFLRQFHADNVSPAEADDEVLVTNGQQVHNLHKDIWYIPDPTLAFIGVPYHVATFSLFEFQAIALAAVFAGRVPLPDQTSMHDEYQRRVRTKGAGRTFHSLRPEGAEIGYVNELVELVNQTIGPQMQHMSGHSRNWHEAYQRRRVRQAALWSTIRDRALDVRVLDLIQGC